MKPEAKEKYKANGKCSTELAMRWAVKWSLSFTARDTLKNLSASLLQLFFPPCSPVHLFFLCRLSVFTPNTSHTLLMPLRELPNCTRGTKSVLGRNTERKADYYKTRKFGRNMTSWKVQQVKQTKTKLFSLLSHPQPSLPLDMECSIGAHQQTSVSSSQLT